MEEGPRPAYKPSDHYGLPSKIAQEYYASFTEFDLNRNGSITVDEMKECLRRAKIEFQDSDVDNKFKNYMDLNHDGKVSLEEFMKFMAAVHRGEREGFIPPTDK